MVLKGKPKNQVTKDTFTIVVYLNLAGDEYEITRHRIQANNIKEAVEKFYQKVTSK